MFFGILLVVVIIVVLITIFFYKPGPHPRLPFQASVLDFLAPIASSQYARAVVLRSKSGPYTLVGHWPRPSISSKELLIRNKAVGLNPIDWKCVTYGFGVHSIPWISGRESAGIVEEVGADVHDFRRGDRVWVASTNYRDNRTSTFQDYVAALPFNVGRLPDWISFEEGATIGVGCVAAAGALYDSLAIPWPSNPARKYHEEAETRQDDNEPWILIWGASCVTGMMAVQLARQSGLRVFAVAGLHNTTKLQDLGAEIIVDRHRPEDAVAEARKLPISLGIDCVGQETATHTINALQPGSKLACLVKRPDQAALEETGSEAMDVLIKQFHEDDIYGRTVVDLISHHLFSKTIRPIGYETVTGGLGAIEGGLQRLRDQGVSGTKLIITVQ